MDDIRMQIIMNAAQELAATEHGGCRPVVALAAEGLGLSVGRTTTLIAQAQKRLGLAKPRKRRADAGKSAITDAELEAISGAMLHDRRAGKWMISVTDIRAAAETIRKKIGKRPNHLTLSADAFQAIVGNAEVRGYLSTTQMGPATVEQLKTILNVATIEVGEAVWIDDTDTGRDVWGNNAVLAYVPAIGAGGASISLAEPGFGFTNVIEGHPFAETPYYENGSKSWIYGATYERRPNVAYNTAAFLFTNPK